MTGHYSKLKTPGARLEYLLLFVCSSRSANSAGAQDIVERSLDAWSMQTPALRRKYTLRKISTGSRPRAAASGRIVQDKLSGKIL